MTQVKLEEIDAAQYGVFRVCVADFNEDKEYERDEEEEGS